MMKKIKLMMFAFVAMFAMVALVACSSDDDDTTMYNTSRYQLAVDNNVKSTKKHDKAILLVAFGSTWQQAFDAFDNTVKAYQKEFKDYDVYLSFSSAICINRAAAGEHVAARNFYSPNYWLEAFGRAKYSEIVVQSLQVIPGEEYTRVVNYIKDFANNSNGDLDDNYLSKVKLYLGRPLMQEATTDVDNLAKALDHNFRDQVAQGAFAFMGHGNPDTYDTYKANVRYSQLETALQKINKNYYVGTVDMPGNYKNNVFERMQNAGINNGKLFLYPLMSIAGDHAHNDMASGETKDIEEFKKNGKLEENDEEISWKTYFNAAGYNCNDNTCIVKGLLELDNVRALWMQHTKDAINDEPLDFYHSKNPE